MKITRTTAGLAATATAAVALLTGCGTQDKDRCGTTPVVMFLGSDGHYHYGSPTGKVVPATKVPSSAQKVPGYKAPAPAAPAVKPPAPKVPAAPAPRPAPPAPRR